MRKPMPFGKFLLLDRIAVGGMAEVFAAKTFGVEGFERLVAIKRILPTMVEDEEFISMFIDEARIASLLNHANIVQIYELGKHDDTFYIAMEYVSGRDVRMLIEKFKKKQVAVPIPLAVYITAKIAEGLDHAHRKKDAQGSHLGIIHRDVSPQNVLVSYEGEVKIIDLGIAKAAGRIQKTQAGILKGKFGYMSPEQVRGIPIDHRSDIFSLGVMLYEMLTSTKLFTGESDFSTLEKVRAGDVRNPSEINAEIPPELERVVLKSLAKERDERYQWGSELHDDLMRFLYASRQEIYSAQKLSQFMKESFPDEFRKESERLKRWDSTAPEETLDFQSSTTLPPVQVAAAVAARPGAHTTNGPGSNGALGDDGKIRIGPPSAFMTAELRLEDRTKLHEAFGAAPGTLPLPPGRSPPPVGSAPAPSPRVFTTEPVTESASLEELAQLSVALQNSGPTAPPPALRSAPPAARRTTDEDDDDESTSPGLDAPLPGAGGEARPGARKPLPLETAAARAPSPSAAPPVAPRRGWQGLVAALAVVVAVLAVSLVLFGKDLKRVGLGQGSLYIEVVPRRDVEIVIDGRLASTTSPLSIRLGTGEHKLAVSAPGHRTHEAAVHIEKGPPTIVKVELEPLAKDPPAPAEVVVVTPTPEPSKAASNADARRAAPPAQGTEAKATREAQAEEARWLAESRRSASSAPVAKPAEPASPPGGLMIFSDPKGAQVMVDDVVKGVTPLRVENLPTSRPIVVRGMSDGFNPDEQRVQAKPGGFEKVNLKLEPRAAAKALAAPPAVAPPSVAPPAVASPAVASPEPAAGAGKAKVVAACTPVSKVLVDGRDTDRWTPITPGNPLEVSAGKHVLSCVTAEGARVDREVVLEAGTVFRFIQAVK
jgi:serine/threonine protein kinase